MAQFEFNINAPDIVAKRNSHCANKGCGIRLNMPPRYCSKVCEDSAFAGFLRDQEREMGVSLMGAK
jgi:hypothetical protein